VRTAVSAKNEVLDQLERLIKDGERMAASFTTRGMGGYQTSIPEAELRTFVTSAFACIDRVAGKGSEYYQRIPPLQGQLAVPGFDASFIPAVTGSLIALRNAVNSGYLSTLAQRVRSRLHDDLLQQANELFGANYHVAAMVLGGSVLEHQLRELVLRQNLSCVGNGSISKYNDLLKDVLYPTVTWRRIQSIGDVRNDAAHGNAGNVRPEDVEDALIYIARFLGDYP